MINGSFSYDPATPVGLIRLYVPGENAQTTAVYSDEELTALYNLYEDVRLAAADALDILASNTAKTYQKVSQMGMSQDGPSMAETFMKAAKNLRDRVDKEPFFDWAEQVQDAFSERERYLKQFLRGQY